MSAHPVTVRNPTTAKYPCLRSGRPIRPEVQKESASRRPPPLPEAFGVSVCCVIRDHPAYIPRGSRGRRSCRPCVLAAYLPRWRRCDCSAVPAHPAADAQPAGATRAGRGDRIPDSVIGSPEEQIMADAPYPIRRRPRPRSRTSCSRRSRRSSRTTTWPRPPT